MKLATPCIFNIYKPVGPTSAQVVNKIKRLLPKGAGKIGHFGTLDPFACGVLVVGVGGATRLTDYAHKLPKTYRAVGVLGQQSPTGDILGEVEGCPPAGPLQAQLVGPRTSELETLMQQRFLGKYMQSPHQFSAAKHQGKALYQWARAGKQIQKAPVERWIHSLKIIRYRYPYVCFEATVSTGTYIRTLFQDMAQALGTVGLLASLVRTEIGALKVREGLRYQAKNDQGHPTWNEGIFENALALDQFVQLPVVELDQIGMNRFIHGNGVAFAPGELRAEAYWVKGPAGELLGLGHWTPAAKQLLPKINFLR